MPDKPSAFFTKKMFANLLLVCGGISFYMLLENWAAVHTTLAFIFHVFSPFFYGFGLAYLLNIPMVWMEHTLFKRIKRKRIWSIALTYFLMLVLLYALGSLVVPQVWSSVTRLLANVQTYLDNLTAWVQAVSLRFDLDYQSLKFVNDAYVQMVESISAAISSAMPQLLNFSISVSISFGKGIISTFTAIFFSVYCLADKERLLFQCHKLIYAFVPKKRTDRFLQVLRHSNSVFAGFISGKLLDSLIIGLMCFIGMQFIHTELAMLVSVIIGLTNIIPVFGPFIGAVPSILLLLMVEPISAFWFALFILLLQQLDGNIIGPKILGSSTGLSALWVLVSIVVGGGLFGFFGMLLGVPVCSVLYYLGSDALHSRLRAKGLYAKGLEVLSTETDAHPTPLEHLSENGLASTWEAFEAADAASAIEKAKQDVEK